MLALAALLGGLAVATYIPPAGAKHVKGLKTAEMATLMSDMRVQALNPIPLPAFTLPDADNKDFAIKDQVGKVMLINFWTTH